MCKQIMNYKQTEYLPDGRATETALNLASHAHALAVAEGVFYQPQSVMIEAVYYKNGHLTIRVKAGIDGVTGFSHLKTIFLIEST